MVVAHRLSTLEGSGFVPLAPATTTTPDAKGCQVFTQLLFAYFFGALLALLLHRCEALLCWHCKQDLNMRLPAAASSCGGCSAWLSYWSGISDWCVGVW